MGISKRILILGLLFSGFLAWGQSGPGLNLQPGGFSVGFRAIRLEGKSKNPLLITIWYPAEKGKQAVSIEDLIKAGGSTNEVTDSALINGFKHTMELIYESKSGRDQFLNAISAQSGVYKDAAEVEGKFPLIIARAQPVYYFATFGYLASHGYIVATVNGSFADPPPDGPMHYRRDTDLLNDLLDFMVERPNINKSDISCFGHGGAIQPAMYLAMRSSKIKRVINFDGGFFDQRSNSVQSADYAPGQLHARVLDVVTKALSITEDSLQLKALKTPIVRAIIRNEDFRHHDLTAWGRVAVKLNWRGEMVNETFAAINQLALWFLSEQKNSPQNLNQFFAIKEIDHY